MTHTITISSSLQLIIVIRLAIRAFHVGALVLANSNKSRVLSTLFQFLRIFYLLRCHAFKPTEFFGLVSGQGCWIRLRIDGFARAFSFIVPWRGLAFGGVRANPNKKDGNKEKLSEKHLDLKKADN